MTQLEFDVYPLDSARVSIETEITQLIIAGWAGRDPAAIQAHIDELAAIGVAPPSSTPCFYRLSAALLTQANTIEVLGTHSGGEVECVLLDSPLGTLVSIGSDHTDREVEAYGVAVSKQICAKPVARDAWLYADVADHWDRLIMRSWRVFPEGRAQNGGADAPETTNAADASAPLVPQVYQAGPVSGLLAPEELWQRLGDRAAPSRTALYGGTLAVHGDIAAMSSDETFEIELHDPVLDRRLRHRYTVSALPIVS